MFRWKEKLKANRLTVGLKCINCTVAWLKICISNATGSRVAVDGRNSNDDREAAGVPRLCVNESGRRLAAFCRRIWMVHHKAGQLLLFNLPFLREPTPCRSFNMRWKWFLKGKKTLLWMNTSVNWCIALVWPGFLLVLYYCCASPPVISFPNSLFFFCIAGAVHSWVVRLRPSGKGKGFLIQHRKKKKKRGSASGYSPTHCLTRGLPSPSPTPPQSVTVVRNKRGKCCVT